MSRHTLQLAAYEREGRNTCSACQRATVLPLGREIGADMWRSCPTVRCKGGCSTSRNALETVAPELQASARHTR
eukprot:2228742-Prymnesium_polylepis.3